MSRRFNCSFFLGVLFRGAKEGRGWVMLFSRFSLFLSFYSLSSFLLFLFSSLSFSLFFFFFLFCHFYSSYFSVDYFGGCCHLAPNWNPFVGCRSGKSSFLFLVFYFSVHTSVISLSPFSQPVFFFFLNALYCFCVVVLFFFLFYLFSVIFFLFLVTFSSEWN